jgi:hypothetical protein
MSSFDNDVLDFNENDDDDEEAKRFDQKDLKNLKIRIENDSTDPKAEMDAAGEDQMDGIELNEPLADDLTVKKEEKDEEEEGPEFHVTLDKVPPGLQNTILVIKL